MYIRRKVFSLLQDETGEERYFSTTEFVNSSNLKEFSNKEKDEFREDMVKGIKKGSNISKAVTLLSSAGGGAIGYYGAKSLGKNKLAGTLIVFL